MITHEVVTLEQINSKRIYSHLYNNGIATSELTIDYHFWSQFAFLHEEPGMPGAVPVAVAALMSVAVGGDGLPPWFDLGAWVEEKDAWEV